MARFHIFVLNLLESDVVRVVILVVDTAHINPRHALMTCSKDELIAMLDDPQMVLCNADVVDNELWCSSPQGTVSIPTEDRTIALTPQYNLWDFLYALVVDNAAFSIDEHQFKFADISFAMKSNAIYISDGTITKTIWTDLADIDDLSTQVLVVTCSTDVFESFLAPNFKLQGVPSEDGTKTTFSVNPYFIGAIRSSTYAALRYCQDELAYLVSKYLLLKSQMRGLELGYNFLRECYGLPSRYLHFTAQRKYPSAAVALEYSIPCVDASAMQAKLSANRKEYGAKFTSLADDVSKLKEFLKQEFSPNTSGIYVDQFLSAFAAQVRSEYPNDYAFTVAYTEQNKLTALALKIHEYKVAIEYAKLNFSSVISIANGVLFINKEGK